MLVSYGLQTVCSCRAQFCAAADVRQFCSIINTQPLLAGFVDGSDPWPSSPLTFLVPTDSAYRADENQVSASVRKDNPLVEDILIQLFLGSAGIPTPVPMASNKSGTKFTTFKDGAYVTYIKVGSKAQVYITAIPNVKADILRTSTTLGGNLTLVVHTPGLEQPDSRWRFQKGLDYFGCSIFASLLRRYPTQLYLGLSGQVVWDAKTRYPLLLAPTDRAIRNAMLNPKLKVVFKHGGQPLLDLLRYHLLPGATGKEVAGGDTTSNALEDIFTGAWGGSSRMTKDTALSGKKVTFMVTGASKIVVLASSDRPGTRPSPIVKSRAFTAPGAQVIAIDRFLLP